MTERTYRYAVIDDGAYVDVELAGRYELQDEDPAEKAKAVIVSTQQVPEDSVKLEKVDNLQQAIVSENVPQKPSKRKR